MPAAWTVRAPAGCTTAGVEYRVCTVCGENEETRPIPALGHDMPNTWTQITPPTCTEPGLERRECSRFADCGHYETRAIPALGHDLPAVWTVRTAATCEDDGVEYRACQRAGCDHEVTRAIPALGHDWGAWARTTGGDITSLTAIEMTGACSRNIGAACTETVTENKSLAQYITIMAEQGGQPVFLPVTIDLGTMGTGDNGWTRLLIQLHTAGKDVALNLSSSAMIGGTFATGVTFDTRPAGIDTIVSIVLPSTTTTIDHTAFRNASLASVTIPASVTSIGNWAFQGTNLTSVTIPASVTTIGNWAFAENASLTSVSFADGSLLETIGDSAFMRANLTSVTIPASVTTIDILAFSFHFNLASVTVLATTPPTLGHMVFMSNHSTLQIKVPAGSLAAYQAAWGHLLPDPGASRIIAIP